MGKGSIYQEIFFLKVFSHMNRKLLSRAMRMMHQNST